MLQNLFGDDEHTATDGPYSRVMKTRKWIYITAAAATLLLVGQYDVQATRSLLKIVSIPLNTLAISIDIALIYLVLQYSVLVFQLTTTYGIIINERLTFRRADEISAAAAKASEARAAVLKFKNDENDRAASHEQSLVAAVQAAQDDFEKRRKSISENSGDVMSVQMFREALESGVADAQIALKKSKDALDLFRQSRATRSNSTENDPTYLGLLATERAAEASFRKVQSEDPAGRPGYRKAEILIDILRVAPPLLVGAVVALKLSLFLSHL